MPIFHETLSIPKPAVFGNGSWELSKLNEINIIFGKNGSGKSLLLRQLGNGNDNGEVHYVNPERSGNLSYNISQFERQLTPQGRAETRRSNLSSDYRQEVVARIQVVVQKIGVVAGRKQSVKVDLNEIESLFNGLIPDFQIEITGSNPPLKFKRIGQEKPITNVDQLSSGESQILALTLDLVTTCAIWELDQAQRRVLLIDEPDTHLHPDLQQQFADFVTKLVKRFNFQVFIATHSTTLLSAFGFYGGEKTSTVFLNRSNKEKTKFDAIKFDEALRELSTCLGGHALMGPLFSVPLLLVEGDDDYKIWSHVPRHGLLKLAVIPCHGDEITRYHNLLEKLFSSIREAKGDHVGLTLLDGDKTLPQVNPSNPQQHIKYIQLNCHESENLYLTDEVLSTLDLTWEKAKALIKERSGNYGQKCETLNRCGDWDRQQQDLKIIINELADILDSKKLPWTVRVAKAIGKTKPEGQLANFLGLSVMALWKEADSGQL